MITESTIYWLTRLDPIHNLLAGSLVLSGAVIIAIICLQLLLRDDDTNNEKDIALADKLLRVLPLIVSMFLLCLVGNTFIPTMKEMCAIKVIPAIANNEKIQNLGSDVYDLAIEWMKELKPVANKDN